MNLASWGRMHPSMQTQEGPGKPWQTTGLGLQGLGFGVTGFAATGFRASGLGFRRFRALRWFRFGKGV